MENKARNDWLKEKAARQERNLAANASEAEKKRKREAKLFQSLFDNDPNESSSDESEHRASRPYKRALKRPVTDDERMLLEQADAAERKRAQEAANLAAEAREDALRKRKEARNDAIDYHFGGDDDDDDVSHGCYLFEIGDAVIVEPEKQPAISGSYITAHFGRSLDTFKNGSVVQKYRAPWGRHGILERGDYRIEKKIFDTDALCQSVVLRCVNYGGDKNGLLFVVPRALFGHWATEDIRNYANNYREVDDDTGKA